MNSTLSLQPTFNASVNTRRSKPKAAFLRLQGALALENRLHSFPNRFDIRSHFRFHECYRFNFRCRFRTPGQELPTDNKPEAKLPACFPTGEPLRSGNLQKERHGSSRG